MAQIKADKLLAPQFMPGDGCGVFLIDRAQVTAAPAVGDTIDFAIPAGLEVGLLEIQCDDLDTNGTPTIAFSVGYAPIQADTIYSPQATYFAGTGQSTMRTGGRLQCSFPPMKFEEDVMLRLTIGTAAATFQAGNVYAVIGGAARGVK